MAVAGKSRFGAAAALAAACALLALAPRPGAALDPVPDVRDVMTPFRFTPTPHPPQPLDSQRNYDYRARLQSQEHELELLQPRDDLSLQLQQSLIDTESELARLNRATRP